MYSLYQKNVVIYLVVSETENCALNSSVAEVKAAKAPLFYAPVPNWSQSMAFDTS